MFNGCVPERSKGADLRSAAVMLRGFESHHAHHFFFTLHCSVKLTKNSHFCFNIIIKLN